MRLDEELKTVPTDLATVVRALVTFASALVPGTQLVYHPKSRQHIASPRNFLAFNVLRRKTAVRMRLYGHLREFKNQAELALRPYRFSYSECEMSDPAQLAAAARYIKQAAVFKAHGRKRF